MTSLQDDNSKNCYDLKKSDIFFSIIIRNISKLCHICYGVIRGQTEDLPQKPRDNSKLSLCVQNRCLMSTSLNFESDKIEWIYLGEPP